MEKSVCFLYVKFNDMNEFKGFNATFGITTNSRPSMFENTKEVRRFLQKEASQNFDVEAMQLRDANNNVVFQTV